MTIVRLVVAYDGTDFRGLAPNAGIRSVVGELQRVLEPILKRTPDLVMAGRTDAGVHAWGQVLSFEAEEQTLDLGRIQRSVNSRLGPEIVLREIDFASDDFSARFSAIGRRYRYLILNRPVPDPFLAKTAWWVRRPLDVGAMSRACRHLIGTHDFSSFCRQRTPGPGGRRDADGQLIIPTLVRRLDNARWVELNDDVVGPGVLRFEIDGSAFCHQMVRSIVGFLAAVGHGDRQPDELPEVIAARSRSVAEPPAPPHGLTLWQVDYD